MPDIFGRHPEDYTYLRALREAELLERWQNDMGVSYGIPNARLNFEALGNPVPGLEHRATDAATEALGWVTNNMLAVQMMIDEILYTAFRLPMFVPMNTSIEEGARGYQVRIRDRRGRAQRLSAPGWEAPSATVSETIDTHPIHVYGLDAEWSLSELRSARFAGTPLDTESIDAAITGLMETMEEVALTGGDYAEKGLVNLSAGTGVDQVRLETLTDAERFSAITPQAIRTAIATRVSRVITDSAETLGRNIADGMTVYLAPREYDLLNIVYIGDNAEKTVMRSILEDNPWTNRTGRPLTFESVLELENRGTGTTSRMIVTLKHDRIFEIGVPVYPRVLRVMDKGRVICAQTEAEFSPLYVKRPKNIYYVDNVGPNV